MNNKEFAQRCKQAANHKTLYVLGCFGAPLTAANKSRYQSAYAYNRRADRTKAIQAASADTYGFDCVCFVKAILWGWCADENHQYGGAKYASNGVPDIGEGAMISRCEDVSTDFSRIEVGEVVWMPGHIGVYIGDGLVVECTPKWEDGVQITACNCDRNGYNRRNWVKHGKLPYVTYEVEPAPAAQPEPEPERWYRIRKSWSDAAGQLGAYRDLTYAKNACPAGYTVFDWNGNPVYRPDDGLAAFVRQIQQAVGAAMDGIAGPETLSKTPTVSAVVNPRHGVVRLVQQRLAALGYSQVGTADGIAGPKFTAAVKAYQKATGCVADGEITAGNKTWRKLLGME